jgi:murein DD-endopeptidase MepM/ murein hydrolase activator NlpD
MQATPPTGLQSTTLPQRTQERLVDVYFNEDGPLELQKRAAANSTLAKGQSTIKWAQITSTPPKSQDNRSWWQKLTGEPLQADSNPVLIKARIFASADGRPDATNAMIPPSVLGNNDNMCLLESYFEIPAGFKTTLKRGDYVQVDLYNTPGQPPAFKGMSGAQEPDGRIISVGVGSGAVDDVIPPNSKTAYAPRGCEGDSPRPRRPAGGRRSIVTAACARKWKRKSEDLPSTMKGIFPMNPVTKQQAKNSTPEGQLKVKLTDESDYGPRLHPTKKTESFHSGIDFNFNNTGLDFAARPIYSTLDGKVVAVGNQGSKTGWGKFVIVQHGPYYDVDTPRQVYKNATLFTVYAHLDRATVLQGTGVKQGQQIAISDNTGRSTGAHLHFEVIYSKNKINMSDFNAAPRTDPVIFLNSKFVRNGKKLPVSS